MKKSIATLFVIACGLAAAAQGTVLIQNNLGAVIVPFYMADKVTKAVGTDYLVQVFAYSSDPSSPFGIQIGPTMSIAANGRFSSGSQVVPGALPGSTPLLIARCWDSKTGSDYDSASISGRSAVFVSARLGGEGNPPSPPVSMVTLLPNGFRMEILPEPSTTALGIVGGLALLARRQTRTPNS
jgi:hypothetical protein